MCVYECVCVKSRDVGRQRYIGQSERELNSGGRKNVRMPMKTVNRRVVGYIRIYIYIYIYI